MNSNRIEKMLWSIALPGFGQFLNRQYIKGVTLLILEFIINDKSNLNEVILKSFQGKIMQAIEVTDYQWLMFYPCVYMFAIYDAYSHGGDDRLNRFAYLPTVFAAFFATVGLIFSANLRVWGWLPGPVWLTVIFCFIGLGFGYILFKFLQSLTATIDS